MTSTPQSAPRAPHQQAGLLLGPVLAGILLLSPTPDDLAVAGWRTAALGLCMAIWWATEALPVAVTALLPIAAFPIFGIAGIQAVTAPYSNPTIFLFLGGFMVALAVQRWGLHRRIALTVINTFGGSGASIVGGFMLASALVSMWVTNTATTMMLLPIATSVVAVVQQNLVQQKLSDSREIQERFPVALLLGVAYGATLGGMATLVGTPPNALLAAFMRETYQLDIGFAQWMLVGVPLTLCLMPLAWWVLTRWQFPVRFTTSQASREHLHRLRVDLGPMSKPEQRVAMVFLALAISWMLRPAMARIDGLGGLSDAGLAILWAIVLFLIPSGSPEARSLMRWRDASDLPWGILLLFGGGLTLAATVSSTGLAAWLGQRLIALGLSEQVVLVAVVATLVIFLTELTTPPFIHQLID